MLYLCPSDKRAPQMNPADTCVSQVDYKAVADALGITKSAAKQRYYKIKNHFEGLQTPAQTAEDEEPKSEDQPEEDQEDLPDYKSEDDEDDQEMKQEPPEEESQDA